MSNVLVDSKGDLRLSSYIDCHNESLEEIKNSRGIIRDEQNEIVAPSFGYTDTYDNVDDIRGFIESNISDGVYVINSLEGTLLRLYSFKGYWYLSTHNRIDAFKSRWSSSETYGEIFNRAVEEVVGEKGFQELCETLSPEKVYAFLSRPNHENKIFWDPIFAKHLEKLVFIGEWDMASGGQFVLNRRETTPTGTYMLSRFIAPEIVYEYHETDAVDDIMRSITDHVASLNPKQIQGVLVWNKRTNRHVKVLHHKYASMARIRGVNPNPRLRYLELRNDPSRATVYRDEIMPEMQSLFEQYEHILNNISSMIFNSYIARFIKNQYVTLPKDEYIVMKKCHDWFVNDRLNNRINLKKVREILENEPPLSLYKMIRRQQNESFSKQPPIMNHRIGGRQRYGRPIWESYDVDFVPPHQIVIPRNTIAQNKSPYTRDRENDYFSRENIHALKRNLSSSIQAPSAPV